jgi:MFS family permease
VRKLLHKDFALLFAGHAVSQLGDGAGFIALMWWVAARTGSAALLGLLAVSRTIASILVSPLAGAVVDRINKKAILIAADLVRTLTYALMAYLAYTNRLTAQALISLAVLNSVAAQFFQPATGASVPLLVDRSDLARANSLMGITGNIVSIISYGAGGILAAFLGVPLLMLADSVSFALCAAAEAFVSIPDVSSQRGAKKGNFLVDVKDGVLYVRTNRVLLEVMMVAAVLNFFAAPVFMLMPKFVQHDLGGSPAFYGYLLSASMAGTLLASLLISMTKIVEKHSWLVMHGITLQASTMAAFALLPRGLNSVRLPLMVVSGLTNGIVNIYFGAVIQRATAPEQMGRVFGLLATVSMVLQPISQGLAGILGDRIPLAAMYAVCAACVGLGGLRFARIPNLRGFLTASDGAEPAVEPAIEPSETAN